MRAFLKHLQNRLHKDQLYFTSDEAIDFFEACISDYHQYRINAPFSWPEFPPRTQYNNESEEHKHILDKGHVYQSKCDYIRRILDVLYRIRPDISEKKKRIALISHVEQVRIQIKSSSLKNWGSIIDSNYYYGDILRKAGVDESKFQAFLNQNDIISLASHLELTLSETAKMLKDICDSDGKKGSSSWESALLDIWLEVPLLGSATSIPTNNLPARRNYYGAYKRATTPEANARAKKAGRTQKTNDDWFGWQEVNKPIGWEVEIGFALESDVSFQKYLEKFIAVHNERENNDWAAYRRLLTDYIGVNEDGTLPKITKLHRCLRGVMLGYLKSYEIINGESCYSCSVCAPTGNYIPVEDRKDLIIRIGESLESLLDDIEQQSTKWPKVKAIELTLNLIKNDTQNFASLQSYLMGWTNRLLQDSPNHLGAILIRTFGMYGGVLDIQIREMEEFLLYLCKKPVASYRKVLLDIVNNTLNTNSNSPLLLKSKGRLHSHLEQYDEAMATYQNLLKLAKDSNDILHIHDAYQELSFLVPENSEQGVLYQKASARWDPNATLSYKTYSNLATQWTWEEVKEQLDLTISGDGVASIIPALLTEWLRIDPFNKSNQVSAFLDNNLSLIIEWEEETIQRVGDLLISCVRQMDVVSIDKLTNLLTSLYDKNKNSKSVFNLLVSLATSNKQAFPKLLNYFYKNHEVECDLFFDEIIKSKNSRYFSLLPQNAPERWQYAKQLVIALQEWKAQIGSISIQNLEGSHIIGLMKKFDRERKPVQAMMAASILEFIHKQSNPYWKTPISYLVESLVLCGYVKEATKIADKVRDLEIGRGRITLREYLESYSPPEPVSIQTFEDCRRIVRMLL